MTAAALSRGARRDLLAAIEWITRDNPAAAQALHDAVVSLAELIGAHPRMGRVRPELAGPEFRFLPGQRLSIPDRIQYTAAASGHCSGRP